MEYVDIPCNFVANFWVGDNLVDNAVALSALSRLNGDGSFNKLIVVQAGSMVETYLTEIVFRAQHYTREGVPSIPDNERAKIEEKTLEKFAVIISSFRKHHVLDALGSDIYGDLDRLRKLRNKIHIHLDCVPEISRSESAIFSEEIATWALRLNYSVAEFLSAHMPRPEHLHVFTSDLHLPKP